ncbi:MAG: hypothetical protein EXR99_06210 [Gemmataceae bacterium]|nr:hypothetical protein [Gemmataceae bacterium]
MWRSWLGAWKKKASRPRRRQAGSPLELVSLENRVTPSQTVSATLVGNTLTFTSNSATGETNQFSLSQVSLTGTVLRLQGVGGTIFNGTGAIFSTGFNTADATIDSAILPGLNKIMVSGGAGNDQITFGNLDGNVLGASDKNDFDFEVDTASVAAGGGGGIDTLTFNGQTTLKGNGSFLTSNLILAGSNLEGVSITGSGGVNSIGTGQVRLVGDGLATSNVTIQNGGKIAIASGQVTLTSGANGAVRLNGSAVTTVGGSILFSSNAILESSTTLATGLGSGGVTFNGSLLGITAGAENLSINTTGAVAFNGVSGTTLQPLGNIQFIQQAPASLTVNNLFALSLTGTVAGPVLSIGEMVLSGSSGLQLTTTGTLGTVNLGTPGQVTPAVTTTGFGPMTFNNSQDLVVNGNLILDGALSQTGAGNVFLGTAGVVTALTVSTTSDAISFTGPVSLAQETAINSNKLGTLGGGASLTFSSTLDGSFSLNLNAGVGDTTFTGAVGATANLLSINLANTNRFTSSSTITADSFTIGQASNLVQFSGAQIYDRLSGLTVVTATSNGMILVNAPVTCLSTAVLSLNNSGLLVVSSGANLTVDSGSLTLGGSSGGSILLAANLTSVGGAITLANPTKLQADITVNGNGGTVTFANTLDSNSSVANSITLNGSTVSPFFFNKPAGASLPLNNINVTASGGVTFVSSLTAANVTITTGLNTFAVNGNLTLSGNLATANAGSPYALSLTGLNNQVNGTVVLAHTGGTLLGNLNSASFLFSKGLEESGAGGVTSQGNITTGSGMNLLSEFIVGGNNTGEVTLNLGADSIFSNRLQVQAAERITKSGAGGLRLLSNSGGLYQGTLVVNQGLVTVLDSFSSILNTTLAGGTVSGTGSLGPIFGLVGILAPGDVVGTLNAGNTSLNSLTTFAIQAGTIQGAGTDQLNVNGSVILNSPVLGITAGSFLTKGSVQMIIVNDGADAIQGTFFGVGEGTNVVSGTTTFRVSYKGGTGNDITLTVISTVSPPVPVVPGITKFFATAVDAGGGPSVTVNYTSGATYTFFAYDTAFRGGVRLAIGDVNGDGFEDLVTGTGQGGGPHVKVWDVSSGQAIQVASFFSYSPQFTGGIYLACGNLNGDGRDSDGNGTVDFPYYDIIIGAGPGGGPHVKAIAGSPTFSLNPSAAISSFFAYSAFFTGGVTVAAGDRTGDGLDDIVTGAGPGGGPNVSVFAINGTPLQSFFAFDTTFRGGVFVAAGYFTQMPSATPAPNTPPPLADIFVGSGAGMQATVAVAFGTGGYYFLTPFGAFTGGARVGIARNSADSAHFLLAAAGPMGGPVVNLFNSNFTLVDAFFALNPEVATGLNANTTL